VAAAPPTPPRGPPRLGSIHHVRGRDLGRLMAELGIWATTPRRFVRTTRREEEVPLPDLVGWDFAPGEPGRRYVSDITYIRTGQGLATSPRWPMLALAGSWASHSRTGCPMTLSSRPPRRRLGTWGSLAGAIGHTDRAIQYLSRKVRSLLATLGVRQSAGRVATCDDNAVAESFFATLKRELVHNQRFGGLGHGVRSMPGSTATTPCACTRRSATCRPSATSFATLGRAWQPRNFRLSSKWGKGHFVSSMISRARSKMSVGVSERSMRLGQ